MILVVFNYMMFVNYVLMCNIRDIAVNLLT